MKRIFHLAQWAALLAIALFVVRTVTLPVQPPEYEPQRWASWDGFYAISYRGVTREPGPAYVTPRQLAGHLRALRAAGYRTIRPQDALAFLRGRAPLPDKALLLLFEGGRKDSLIAATPPLRAYGFMATMAVPTTYTRRWGSFYLHAKDLKRFLRDPHWSLASMGHDAVQPIPVGPDREGHFLSRRLWNGGRGEDDAAFRARIREDFATAARVITRTGYTNTLAYCFPYADAGTAADADPLAADLIAEALAAHHPLAFSRADDAFNGPDGDPLQLTRLPVAGPWDAATLLAELDKAAPRAEEVQGVGGPDNWTFTGAGEAVAGELHLDGDGVAWLRGTALWSDVHLEARLVREPGATCILYARHAGPQSHLRVTLDDDGIHVQEELGRALQTLANLPVKAARGEAVTYDLDLRVKGNRLWLARNGADAIGPIPLTRHTTRGRIGFETGGGAIEVTSFRASPLRNLVALAPSYRAVPAPHRGDVGILVPAWFGPGLAPSVSAEQRSDLLAAAADGVEVVPLLAQAADAHGDAAAALADALCAALARDVTTSLIRRIALPDGADDVARALRARGLGLVRIADAAGAERLLRDDRAVAEDFIVIEGADAAARAAAEALMRRLPASRLALLDGTGDAPRGVGVARRYAM